MNVMFNLDPETFKMHAEGVGTDVARKMEMAWHAVELRVFGENGDVVHTICADKDGSFEIKDGEPDPMSRASKVVEDKDEPAKDDMLDYGADVAGFKDDATLLQEAVQLTHESGFAAMSHRADDMQADEENHEAE